MMTSIEFVAEGTERRIGTDTHHVGRINKTK